MINMIHADRAKRTVHVGKKQWQLNDRWRARTTRSCVESPRLLLRAYSNSRRGATDESQTCLPSLLVISPFR